MRKFIEVHVISDAVPISLNIDRIIDFYPDHRLSNGAYIKCIDIGLLHVTESYAYLQKSMHALKKKKEGEVKDEAISVDMLYYKGNRLSFGLILLSIAFNIAMFLVIYKVSTQIYAANVQLGIDLFINVIYMFLCFLTAEKNKRYIRTWGLVAIVLGLVQLVRILWIPLVYYLNKGLSLGGFAACIVLLVLCAVCNIVAGMITLAKERIRQDNEPMIKQEEVKKDVRT